MYQVIFTPPARKDIKKLPQGVQNYIELVCLVELEKDPYANGQKLRGIFRVYWKYTFTYKGVHYRVVYQVEQNKLFVYLLIIGARENFYKELKRRIRYKESYSKKKKPAQTLQGFG